jgi:hypothetical protein
MASAASELTPEHFASLVNVSLGMRAVVEAEKYSSLIQDGDALRIIC